jgi:hypothetical protein
LMHYKDAETHRWREFLEQDCDALGSTNLTLAGRNTRFH